MSTFKQLSTIIAKMFVLVPLSGTVWSDPFLPEDLPADASTLKTVTVGSFETGVIDSAEDVDWMRVSLEANVKYKISMTSDKLPEVNLKIINADFPNDVQFQASQRDVLPPMEAVIIYTPSFGTDYFLIASANHKSTGYYIINVEVLERPLQPYPILFPPIISTFPGGAGSGGPYPPAPKRRAPTSHKPEPIDTPQPNPRPVRHDPQPATTAPAIIIPAPMPTAPVLTAPAPTPSIDPSLVFPSSQPTTTAVTVPPPAIDQNLVFPTPEPTSTPQPPINDANTVVSAPNPAPPELIPPTVTTPEPLPPPANIADTIKSEALQTPAINAGITFPAPEVAQATQPVNPLTSIADTIKSEALPPPAIGSGTAPVSEQSPPPSVPEPSSPPPAPAAAPEPAPPPPAPAAAPEPAPPPPAPAAAPEPAPPPPAPAAAPEPAPPPPAPAAAPEPAPPPPAPAAAPEPAPPPPAPAPEPPAPTPTPTVSPEPS